MSVRAVFDGRSAWKTEVIAAFVKNAEPITSNAATAAKSASSMTTLTAATAYITFRCTLSSLPGISPFHADRTGTSVTCRICRTDGGALQVQGGYRISQIGGVDLLAELP